MAAREWWGYAFDCDYSLTAMVAILSDGGPWTWQLRDSSVFGDYLMARPAEDSRVRIHDPRQWARGMPESGYAGPGPYRLTAEVGPDAQVSREQIDRTVLELLKRLGSRHVAVCEPFD